MALYEMHIYDIMISMQIGMFDWSIDDCLRRVAKEMGLDLMLFIAISMV